MSVRFPNLGRVCGWSVGEGGGGVDTTADAAAAGGEREIGFWEERVTEIWNGRRLGLGDKRGMGEKREEEWRGSLLK